MPVVSINTDLSLQYVSMKQWSYHKVTLVYEKVVQEAC